MPTFMASPAEGKRGFRTFKPPPEGCVGWKQHKPPTNDNEVNQRCAELVYLFAPSVPLEPEEPPQQKLVEQLRREVSPLHLGPLRDNNWHLRAAKDDDLDALQACDEQLQSALEADEGMLNDGSEGGPGGKDAMRLYRSALGAFDPQPKHNKLAFQAVMNDDDRTLAALFESGGVDWDAKNAAGQTLLELAIERRRPRAQAAILAAREQQKSGREVRERQRLHVKTERERLAERRAAEALELERQRRAREEAEKAQAAHVAGESGLATPETGGSGS